MELAASEHGLQEIAGIHGRTLGFTGTDNVMKLVDEKDDAAFGFLHGFENRFETLFELAAVFGTGDERTHIERNDSLFLQAFRYVTAHDALRQPFSDGGLADAGLTDEHGIVLPAPGKDLDHTTDLVVATDHGVELSRRRELGQIAPVLL